MCRLRSAAYGIHVQQEIIDEIAQDLCAFFHQESVLITTGFAKARTIRVEPVEH